MPYRLEISAADSGAVGTIFVNGGFYTDMYVKTPRGWRFRSRTVITNREHAAGLSSADFVAIRRLVERSGGPYADIYERVSGGWRFKSAGLSVQPSAEGATGIAYLAQDGGRYEDLYERTSTGWRFKSRSYVPPPAGGEATLQLR